MGKLDPKSYSEEEMRAMRGWVADCEWGDVDSDNVDQLSDEAIIRGVRKFYAGGVAQFLADYRAGDLAD